MSETRARIVEIADDLFYRQGFENTSFADIAGVANISRGNFYYHFQTKDEILNAVISRRIGNTQSMLDGWELQGATPKARIRCFIDILLTNGDKIRDYGCPVGTLTSELAKLGHPSLEKANELFSLFRAWLKQQFIEMGQGERSNELALHILSRSQGIATLYNAFKDPGFVTLELKQIYQWLDQLEENSNPS